MGPEYSFDAASGMFGASLTHVSNRFYKLFNSVFHMFLFSSDCKSNRTHEPIDPVLLVLNFFQVRLCCILLQLRRCSTLRTERGMRFQSRPVLLPLGRASCNSGRRVGVRGRHSCCALFREIECRGLRNNTLIRPIMRNATLSSA